jgi:gluconate kinase
MKEIIILFGEMGAGKNYHGERLAQCKGYSFYDGDLSATPEMIEKVSQFKSLSRTIIFHFVNRLCANIIEKASLSNGLVVAQALYFDEDRKYLQYTLSRLGYTVRFKWIKPSLWRNLKQIYSRPQGGKWAQYWLMNKFWFEKPTHDAERITE